MVDVQRTGFRHDVPIAVAFRQADVIVEFCKGRAEALLLVLRDQLHPALHLLGVLDRLSLVLRAVEEAGRILGFLVGKLGGRAILRFKHRGRLFADFLADIVVQVKKQYGMIVLLHHADGDAEAVIRVPVLQGEDGLAQRRRTDSHGSPIIVRPADGVGMIFGTRSHRDHLFDGVEQEFHILAALCVKPVGSGEHIDQPGDTGGIESDAVAGKAHDRVVGV